MCRDNMSRRGLFSALVPQCRCDRVQSTNSKNRHSRSKKRSGWWLLILGIVSSLNNKKPSFKNCVLCLLYCLWLILKFAWWSETLSVTNMPKKKKKKKKSGRGQIGAGLNLGKCGVAGHSPGTHWPLLLKTVNDLQKALKRWLKTCQTCPPGTTRE